MEHLLLAYLLNVAWQLPLATVTAAAAKSLLKPSARTEHFIWLAALLTSALLPMIPLLVTPSGPPSLDSVHLPAISTPAQGSGFPGTPSLLPSIIPASVALAPAAAHLLAALYLGTVVILAAALLRSLLLVRRLVRGSRPVALPGPVQGRLARLAPQLPTWPELRETDALDSPAVVGAIRPILLLPSGFCGRDGALVASALLHELAHVSRRDYALNLCCRCLFLAIGWHPLSWIIASAIHESREAACDEAAAGRFGSRGAYAENLVTLARSLLPRAAPPPAAAVGLLRHTLIERRVKRLVTRPGKVTACRAACVVAILSASAYASATIRIAAAYDTGRTEKIAATDRTAAPAASIRLFQPPSPLSASHIGPRRWYRRVESSFGPTQRDMIAAPPADVESPPRSEGAAPPADTATPAGAASVWDAAHTAQFARDMEAARRGAADAARRRRSGNLQRAMEAARRGAEDASRPWRSGDLQRAMEAGRQGAADSHGGEQATSERTY